MFNVWIVLQILCSPTCHFFKKSNTLWIQLSLSFWCLYLLRGVLTNLPLLCTPNLPLLLDLGPWSTFILHVAVPHKIPGRTLSPAFCAYYALYSQCFPTLRPARYKEHVLLIMSTWWSRGSGKLAMLGGCCFPHGLIKLCMLGQISGQKWTPSKPTP